MRLVATLIAGVLFIGTSADAEVIDFDGLGSGNFSFATIGNFQLTAVNTVIANAATIPGSVTQTLLQTDANQVATLSISRIGGGLFSLTNFLWGFDALNASNAVSPSTVSSGALSETFRAAGGIGDTSLTTFTPSGALSGGIGVNQLNFSLSNNGGGNFGLDSIDLALVSGATVPEPSSFVALFFGGAAFWGVRRRRGQKQVT